jgi:uncharacterized protein YecT (DUF1311 family)
MRIILALAAVAAFSPAIAPLPAQAADKAVEARYTKGFKNCPGFSGSTAEMIGCVDQETQIQDKRLNETYKKAMDGLTAGQKAKLKNAQRAWLAYRDAWCTAQQDSDWGTLSNIAAANCILEQTVRRTMELENYPPET